MMEIKQTLRFLLLTFTVLSFLIGIFSPSIYAMTEADHNAITHDTPFYDDIPCGGDTVAGSGKEALFFPDCITDINKCIEVINNYIKNYGSGDSPMNDMGDDFCNLGKQYDVNPAWAVAVAQHETSLGSAGVGESCNNAFGIKQHDDWPSCSTGFSGYSNFTESIEDFYKLVSGPTYLDDPEIETLEDIIARYAPSSDGNDEEAYFKAIVDVIDVIMKDMCPDWQSLSSSGDSSTGGSDSEDDSDDSGNEDDTGSDSGLVEGVDTITDKDGEKHVIPAKSGKYGYEQHLGIVGYNDANNAEKHYEITNVPPGPMRNGMAGGNGALPTRDKNEEIYYIAMRWRYEGGGTGNEDPSWYQNTHPRVVVTYKKGNDVKQVIAAAVDWGPASSTGRVAGLSPEANKVIHPAKQDDGLETYAWAKDQSLEPGPVDGSGSGVGSASTNCPSSIEEDFGVGDDKGEDKGGDGEECKEGEKKEDGKCVKCKPEEECEPVPPCEEGEKLEGDQCVECTPGDEDCEIGVIPPPPICKKGEKLNKNGTKCIKCNKNENCPGTQPPPKPKPDSDCKIGIGKGGFVFPLCTTKKELQDTLKKHPGTSQIPCKSGYCHHDYPAGDLGDPIRTPVIAAVGGKVVGAEDYGSCNGGYDVPRVRIHGKDGHWFYYTHMKPGSVSGNKIKVGKRVDAAQTLGAIGPSSCAQGTPPHLHFDMSNVDNSFARSPKDNYAAAKKYLINPWSWLNSSYEDLPAK